MVVHAPWWKAGIRGGEWPGGLHFASTQEVILVMQWISVNKSIDGFMR
jgi:hypothetical protein